MSSIDDMRTFDSAFGTLDSGATCHVVAADGTATLMPVHQWGAEPDWVDTALFLDPCDAPTLDIGCGPGRLAAALADRDVHAMGIDVSAEAVRRARDRGAVAIRRDVFARLPGEGRWRFALLADGNLGIGGDPVRLLQRVDELLDAEGVVVVEVAGRGIDVVDEERRLLVDGTLSEPFAWSVVGLDGIGHVAADAGFDVVETSSIGGRHAAVLRRTT